MKKKYRIIIDVIGKPPVVEAESVAEAEEKFSAGVTSEQLLQLLKFGAEEMSEERAPEEPAPPGFHSPQAGFDS
jgi:hypothetical protein